MSLESTHGSPTGQGTIPWSAVADRLRPFVRARVGSDADTDDVLQEVLMRAARKVGQLRDDTRLDAWLYAIARRCIADHHRAGGRGPRDLPLDATGDAAALQVDAPSFVDDAAAARALAQVLHLFIDGLPEPYREALVLTDIEGRSQREAAAHVGVSLSGMKSRVQRGRAKLRASLEACCHIGLDARGRVVAVEPRPDGVSPCEC